MRAKKPVSPQRIRTVIAAVVVPLAVFGAASVSDLLPAGLLSGVTGALVGAAFVYLPTLHRERRRTIAAFLISSWCVVLVGSAFVPAPSGTHPFFDLGRPEGCLAYGFALGFGVAAVGRWVNAGKLQNQRAQEGTPGRIAEQVPADSQHGTLALSRPEQDGRSRDRRTVGHLSGRRRGRVR